jgi:DNA-binding SARP family transcriptional activator
MLWGADGQAALPLPGQVPPHFHGRLREALGAGKGIRDRWTAEFEGYLRTAGTTDPLAPDLAWRVMWMLQMQGEFHQVPSVLENIALEREDSLDEAWLMAFAASAHRFLGDLVTSRRFAHRSLAVARRCGRPGAFGPAHNVLALLAAADGDWLNVVAHFTSAEEMAEAENDPVQLMLTRTCRALHTLETGSPRQAAGESTALLELSRQHKAPFFEAHAHTLLGRAGLHLGSVDEAGEELGTAIELFQRLGSRLLAWPLSGLGDLHRTRGQLARARSAYEEALRTAIGGRDSIGASSALIGLARVRAADDLALARRLADRAVAEGDPLHHVAALLARGWVALLAQDRRSAALDAARAGAAARRRRDDLGLAEAILLTVQSAEDPASQAEQMTEAIQIWQESGCLLDECVARLVLGSVSGAPWRPETDRVMQTLRANGVDIESRRAAGPLAVLIRSTRKVSIQALGVFQVIRDGAPVPKGEWQSKKARDLLKILVAQRRPTPRDRLAELLWPDSDPGKSANRLSVLLSTVRDILEPRPGEPNPLMSDGSVVWLDSSRVRIDAEEFMERAGAALNAYRSGGLDAPELLMSALAAYSGELFEDDPYQDWAGQLAEEIRAKRIAVLRALVSSLRTSGDVDRVIEVGLRLLEQDPYDEEVRLDLVAALMEAGRLGEARRHYDIYAERMREIDIEPRPMPRPRPPSAPLTGGTAARRPAEREIRDRTGV